MTPSSSAVKVASAPWLERISPRQWVGFDVAVAAFFTAGFVTHFFLLAHAHPTEVAGTNRVVLGSLFLLARPSRGSWRDDPCDAR